MNQEKFNQLRSKYPVFIYDKYDIEEDNEKYLITFYFEIPSLTFFNPTMEIYKDKINNNIDRKYMEYLVFHIGLVELVSYFKCTCSPHVIINAGYLSKEQLEWFHKLYYNGLGEFMYVNGIECSYNDLMCLECTCKETKAPVIDYIGIGNLIPIGGGKDSVVTLNILDSMKNINTAFIINPKEPSIKCTEAAGYHGYLEVKRNIDQHLLDLNREGFLNGHTPFSAIVAFTSFLCAYLSNKKYIILSNEASANEATVLGTNINHQYSKTYEFENDFNNYTKKYFNIDIKYFSLLRCLSEFQIGMLFSHYDKYHSIFKSCNVGSKNSPWVWCTHCPKCLFVYIILSPFLYKDELINIFNTDMFEDEHLLSTFIELLGYGDTKPFECVGTYGEVRYAVSLTISKLGDNLPYLLQYYKDNFPLELDVDYKTFYNNTHNIEPIFEDLVKEELMKYV